MRILLLSNAPTPYNDALFRRVAQQPGVQLLVVYGASLERHRLWVLDERKDYEAVFLPGMAIGTTAHLNPGIGRVIRSFDPQVAVLTGGYVMPTLQMAALMLRLRGTPWAYWGEQLQRGGGTLPRRALRHNLRWAIRQAAGVFAVGTRAIDSYVEAGVPRRKITDFRYYPDFDNFQLTEQDRRSARAMLRSQLSIGMDATVFTFCGQLIDRKGVDTLLRAQAALESKNIRCTTVLVGDGPERRALESLASSLELTDSTQFVGFVQPADLPRYLAASDVLVVPSRREGWGLVVPEAMAAGLPVIASDQVNAALDLVESGRSGYLFPVDDVDALSTAMCSVCSSPMLVAKMARQARVAAQRETPVLASERMVRLLQCVMRGADICAL